jgi:hypothetical protein
LEPVISLLELLGYFLAVFALNNPFGYQIDLLLVFFFLVSITKSLFCGLPLSNYKLFLGVFIRFV